MVVDALLTCRCSHTPNTVGNLVERTPQGLESLPILNTRTFDEVEGEPREALRLMAVNVELPYSVHKRDVVWKTYVAAASEPSKEVDPKLTNNVVNDYEQSKQRNGMDGPKQAIVHVALAAQRISHKSPCQIAPTHPSPF